MQPKNKSVCIVWQEKLIDSAVYVDKQQQRSNSNIVIIACGDNAGVYKGSKSSTGGEEVQFNNKEMYKVPLSLLHYLQDLDALDDMYSLVVMNQKAYLDYCNSKKEHWVLKKECYGD